MPDSPTGSSAFFLSFRHAAGGIALAVGSIVLLGWALEVERLKSLATGFATMKANTAACFVLSGASLRLLPSRDEGAARAGSAARISRGAALAVAAIAALTLGEDCFGWDAGIDQMLVRDPGPAGRAGAPGRMALMTSLNFLMTAVSLVLYGIGRRRAAELAQILASAVCVVATLVLLGYLYGATGMYEVRPFSSVALHTALTFLVLDAGLLAARPHLGWVRHVAGSTPTAAMGRRLLLATFVVLPALGWLRLEGQRAGWYGTEFGIALVIALAIVVLAILIVRITRLGNAVHEKMERSLTLNIASRTAAAVAHDLNQPLHSVVSYSEAALQMLRSGDPKPEQLQHALQSGVAQALRAGRIVRDLLRLLQVGEAGTEAVDLEPLVWKALSSVRDEGLDGFQASVLAPASLRPVRVNRVQIEKVLVNLIRNSAEALRGAAIASPSIAITIAPAADPDMALVTVHDNGPGIDPALARRIFDPFVTTKAGGLGVGLAICHSIVELHNGRLWLETPENGTTLRFTVPFV